MVVNGRLRCRFNGYHAPIVPRAPRSIRGKGLRNRAYRGGPTCAFELLATVAGKLMQESECSSASSSAAVGLDHCSVSKDGIKQEAPDVGKSFGEHDEQGSSGESIFLSRLRLKDCNQKESNVLLVSDVVGEASFEPTHTSGMASFSSSGKSDSDVESAACKAEYRPETLPSISEGGVPNSRESYDADLDIKIDRQPDINGVVAGAKDADGFCGKSPTSSHSNGIVELPLHPNSGPPFLRLKKDASVGTTGDNRNFSQSSQPSIRTNARLSHTHCDDKQIWMSLTSKYWEEAAQLKDSEVLDTVSKVKQVHRIRKSCHEHEGTQCDTPFKKRKLLDQNSIVAYDGGNTCECASNSLDKDTGMAKSSCTAMFRPGKIVSSSFRGHQKLPSSISSNVKFSIKSFKVPELVIEVPESATVGYLKRSVLDAVTAIVGGGLCVGILRHGEKVGDDNRTLLQTGISCKDDLDTLGFLLESRTPTQPSPPAYPESPVPLTCRSPLHRSQITPEEDLTLSNAPDKPSAADSGSHGDSGQGCAPCPTTADLVNKKESDSGVLIPVHETTVEPLAMVVPMSQRPSGSENGRRRTRRPFSVTEVEALVKSVEKLGTGRWRDVKLCAFENGNYRTYVDLKDKWKTLVHTARISPQQRRGEPVPQELLDRVLAAHAYWTQKHHAKQQQRMNKVAEVSAHC